MPRDQGKHQAECNRGHILLGKPSRQFDTAQLILLRLPPQAMISLRQRGNSRRTVSRDIERLKALLHLRRDEHGSPLEAFVAVFLVDGGVMLLRVFAAFDHHRDEAVELRVGVVGVVDVRGRLDRVVSMDGIYDKTGVKNLPIHLS